MRANVVGLMTMQKEDKPLKRYIDLYLFFYAKFYLNQISQILNKSLLIP